MKLKASDCSLSLQTFTGNRDFGSVVTQAIVPPIVARYIQIRPRGWRSLICMRVELYGCPAGALLLAIKT